MVLQDKPQIRDRGRIAALPSREAGNRPVQRRVVTQPSAPATPRTYPPIMLPSPPLGQAVVQGLSGILRSTLLLVLFAAALITSAMLVAVVIGRVIEALGFQPWTAY